MIRYKLARIVDRRYLSANQYDVTPNGDNCLEYVVGRVTSARGIGIACYKGKEYATRPEHLLETKVSFNFGKPIVLLKLQSIGKCIFNADMRYLPSGAYEGGINYPSVKVLEVIDLP